MLLGIAIQIVFSWALLYWPPLQKVLGTGPVSTEIYLLAWLGIPLIFGLDYLRKRLAGESGEPAPQLQQETAGTAKTST